MYYVIVHYCETEYITCYSRGLAGLQYQGRVIYKREILFKSACLIMTKKHAPSTEEDITSNIADCPLSGDVMLPLCFHEHHPVCFHARLVVVGKAL